MPNLFLLNSNFLSGLFSMGLISGGIWTYHRMNIAAPAAPLQNCKKAVKSVAVPGLAAKPMMDFGFTTFGGGGAPSYNEIAIEKNVFYFQRTLTALGQDPSRAKIWFANGEDGRKTVRYIEDGEEKFKAPTIPGIQGSATFANLRSAMQDEATQAKPSFFYFTGHGSHNKADENNNAMILWNEQNANVRQFTAMLDQFPPQKPFVAVMVQCYSGAFANLIYKGGNPKQGVALHDRCGFFATVKERPSVGCTPEVNEADYRDYSSSFFAGLSGISRTGQKVDRADYDRDDRISFREAHAFAKIDEKASDLPVSTLEVWLQENFSNRDRAITLSRPMRDILKTARPEQRQVVRTLAQRLEYDLGKSHRLNLNNNQRDRKSRFELDRIYSERIELELINIAAEKKVREGENPEVIALLEKLLNCEGRSF
jgi:hypothetical protein